MAKTNSLAIQKYFELSFFNNNRNIRNFNEKESTKKENYSFTFRKEDLRISGSNV